MFNFDRNVLREVLHGLSAAAQEPFLLRYVVDTVVAVVAAPADLCAVSARHLARVVEVERSSGRAGTGRAACAAVRARLNIWRSRAVISLHNQMTICDI